MGNRSITAQSAFSVQQKDAPRVFVLPCASALVIPSAPRCSACGCVQAVSPRRRTHCACRTCLARTWSFSATGPPPCGAGPRPAPQEQGWMSLHAKADKGHCDLLGCPSNQLSFVCRRHDVIYSCLRGKAATCASTVVASRSGDFGKMQWYVSVCVQAPVRLSILTTFPNLYSLMNLSACHRHANEYFSARRTAQPRLFG